MNLEKIFNQETKKHLKSYNRQRKILLHYNKNQKKIVI